MNNVARNRFQVLSGLWRDVEALQTCLIKLLPLHIGSGPVRAFGGYTTAVHFARVVESSLSQVLWQLL